MSTYAMVLFVAGIIPFIMSFFPLFGIRGNVRALFISITFIVLLFGAWDIFATWRGHWHFEPERVWALRIINLPLEEVLFFLVIPFCCVLTWNVIQYIFRQQR